jgi:hypothetical protein
MRLQASHSVMGASKQIKQQAKSRLNFLMAETPHGGNTADNRRERQ